MKEYGSRAFTEEVRQPVRPVTALPVALILLGSLLREIAQNVDQPLNTRNHSSSVIKKNNNIEKIDSINK